MSIRILLLTLVVAALGGATRAHAQTEGDPPSEAGAPQFIGDAALARIGAALSAERSEPAEPAPAAQQADPRWIEQGRACDGCLWRRPGHALLQTTMVNVLYELGNLARGQVTARITPATWWDNMENGWVWDLDDFTVNQFGHPYQGSNYFNTGRGNGLSFYESAAVTAFGSATWEYFGETNKPALNDLINTTLGGVALGEMFHRAAWLVRRPGSTSLGREIAATAIDPLTGLNRFMSGDATRVTGTPPEFVPKSLAGLFSLGVLWQGDEGRAVDATGKSFFEVDMLYGDLTADRSRTPYDAFLVRLRLGGGGAVSSARIRGRLIGQPLGSGKVQFTITQNYDFDKNEAYEFGAQAFEANLGVLQQLSSRVSMYLTGGGGVTALGAVNSVPLVPLDLPDSDPSEGGQGISEGPRTFDYGPGSNFAASAVFRYDDREFAVLRFEGRHLFVLDGVRANHLLQRAGFDVLVPLPGTVSLGFSGEWFDRRTYYKDEAETRLRFDYPQFRTFLAWRLQ
jgi:hypothetical protein